MFCSLDAGLTYQGFFIWDLLSTHTHTSAFKCQLLALTLQSAKIIVPHTNLVYWPLMGGVLHLVQRGGDWAPVRSPHRLLLAVPNVTAHPSTASVPITVLLYDGPLFCGFNVSDKGLSRALGGVLYSSNEPSELSQWLYHNDSIP